jgi:hypothetical protein
MAWEPRDLTRTTQKIGASKQRLWIHFADRREDLMAGGTPREYSKISLDRISNRRFLGSRIGAQCPCFSTTMAAASSETSKATRAVHSAAFAVDWSCQAVEKLRDRRRHADE